MLRPKYIGALVDLYNKVINKMRLPLLNLISLVFSSRALKYLGALLGRSELIWSNFGVEIDFFRNMLVHTKYVRGVW